MCLEQRPHSIAKLGDALRLLSSRADDDAFPDMLVIERRLALAQLLDTLGIEAAAPEQRRAFEIGAAECFSPFVFRQPRSEEHTSALQSLMSTSYAVFCLKKKTESTTHTIEHNDTNV